MLALGSLAFASPWLLVALAGAAGDLVAVAGHAAGAAPHALPGDPAAARAGAARGDAGAHAAVADPAAHAARRAGDPGARPSAAQPQRAASAAAGRWCWSSTTAGRRRPTGPTRQTAMAELLAEAERESRRSSCSTTAPRADGGPIAASGLLRAADARRRSQALQPKPWPIDRTAALAALQHSI